jgi:hypothetical protein
LGVSEFFLLWLLLAAIGFLLLGLQHLANRIGWRPAVGTVALALAATLLVPLTVRAGWIATYHNGDIPREMLVYTQTSPELHRVARQIDSLARITDEGQELPIQIDTTGSYAWPWYWYLRRYDNVTWREYELVSVPVEQGSLVYVINASNRQKVEADMPASMGEGRRIVHRWWFPENYRNGSGEQGQMVPSDFFGMIVRPGRWRGAIDYFLYRELSNPIGSTDSYIYFSESLPLQAIR